MYEQPLVSSAVSLLFNAYEQPLVSSAVSLLFNAYEQPLVSYALRVLCESPSSSCLVSAEHTAAEMTKVLHTTPIVCPASLYVLTSRAGTFNCLLVLTAAGTPPVSVPAFVSLLISKPGGRNSSLVVFGLSVHSVAGSILLWGIFSVEGIFPLELTWAQTPFPKKLFRMRV